VPGVGIIGTVGSPAPLKLEETMKFRFVVLLAAALLPAAVVAQTSTADIAPRTELHAIPSMTLSDVVAKSSQTVRACTIKEGPTGVLVNTATGAPFAYTDACVQLDPHVGRNAAAAAAAQAAVGDFVRTLFKLK